MNILVTGGAGYIGSHTVVELIKHNHTVTIVENFSNSNPSVIKAIEKITETSIHLEESDIRGTENLTHLMEANCIEAVIHFAAFKAVGESVEQPLKYYDNNISGLLSVLQAMNTSKVNMLIYSSSATVYGDPDTIPITEDSILKRATNPYGATKQMGEQIIQDACKASDLQAILLRYFNPIGAHESGLIGEKPSGIPNNLVPILVQAAAGVREKLTVYGDDYNTPDGSGVRDYIHVVDLAEAHVAALDYLLTQKEPTSVFNIGTGSGVSVLDLIRTFEHVNGVSVPYEIGKRRDGDIAMCYADASKANTLLGWKARKTLNDSLKDAWRWQQNQ